MLTLIATSQILKCSRQCDSYNTRSSLASGEVPREHVEDFQCHLQLYHFVYTDLIHASSNPNHDLVIYSNTFEQHLKHLAEVVKRIGDAGLTVKVGKCQFAMSRCGYLGHVVGSGSVHPEKAKLTAVEEFPVPETKGQVRVSWTCGYYTDGLYLITPVLQPH